jgi:predicted RNA-binding protein associated with RNAse of E/G family
MAPGEWLRYSVTAQAGSYDLGFRVAAAGAGGTFHLEVDGIDKTGPLTGIYGNVTYPTAISTVDDEIVVSWHDLYLDVLRLGDGAVLLCDEDELADSGLATTDRDLHARITSTAEEMLTLARSGEFPFHPQSD